MVTVPKAAYTTSNIFLLQVSGVNTMDIAATMYEMPLIDVVGVWVGGAFLYWGLDNGILSLCSIVTNSFIARCFYIIYFDAQQLHIQRLHIHAVYITDFPLRLGGFGVVHTVDTNMGQLRT